MSTIRQKYTGMKNYHHMMASELYWTYSQAEVTKNERRRDEPAEKRGEGFGLGPEWHRHIRHTHRHGREKERRKGSCMMSSFVRACLLACHPSCLLDYLRSCLMQLPSFVIGSVLQRLRKQQTSSCARNDMNRAHLAFTYANERDAPPSMAYQCDTMHALPSRPQTCSVNTQPPCLLWQSPWSRL